MGFASLLALIIVCTTGGLLIRNLWRNWRQADRDWRIAQTDARYARTHRIQP